MHHQIAQYQPGIEQKFEDVVRWRQGQLGLNAPQCQSVLGESHFLGYLQSGNEYALGVVDMSSEDHPTIPEVF
jgi:hypothetical protein